MSDKQTATELAIERDRLTMLSEALDRLLRSAVIERDEALDALQDLYEAIQEAGWHRSHTKTAEAILRKHGRVS